MAKSARKVSAPKTSSGTARGGELHDKRFPNESPVYRRKRDALLRAEIALRRQTEKVAAERRALPLGGKVPEDYVFEEYVDAPPFTAAVAMSELFGKHKTLIAYSYMYGPDMTNPCPACTSMLDALDGNAEAIDQRAALVVIAKSPIGRVRTLAKERGWSKLRLLSSAGNSYNRDYFGEGPDGAQWPVLNVFAKRGRAIHHVWASELFFAPSDPGQHSRHVDMIWPLWNALDLIPEGRGTNWHPKLSYTN
jgi:predicted dithiol-disulfide oxidoreductase (DUF899 family)